MKPSWNVYSCGNTRVGLGRVRHVLLDAEVVHAQVEVQRRGHADRAQVGGAVAAGAHVVQLGQRRDLAQVRDAAGVHDGRRGCSRSAAPGSAAGSRRCVLKTSPTASGVVVCCRIRRNASCSSRPAPDPPSRTGGTARGCLPSARRLDRRQPVVDVVQQVRRSGPNSARMRSNSAGTKFEVGLGAPDVLGRQPPFSAGSYGHAALARTP